MTPARVETSAEDGSMRIALSGAIDLANTAAVEDEIWDAVSHQPSAVSVDRVAPGGGVLGGGVLGAPLAGLRPGCGTQFASSPCVGIRLPEIRNREFFIPDPEQIHRLVEEISDRYSPIPYLAAGCGLRGSEIFGLELGQVDFLSREIHVRQQLKRMPKVPPYLGELKTKTSRRTVELPEIVQLALARHVEMYPIREIVIEDRTDTRNIHQRPARLLFLTAHHRPLHRSNWSAVAYGGPTCRAAGWFRLAWPAALLRNAVSTTAPR